MQENALKKMSRKELLELLYEQGQQIDRQKQEIEDLNAQITGKEVASKEAGSIADAAMNLFNIFETAQKAADAYLDSIKGGFAGSSAGATDMERLRKNVHLARNYTDKVKRSMLLECRMLSELEDILIAVEESID